MGDAEPQKQRSWLARVLRAVARAIVLAFVFGFAVGSVIRCAGERAA